MNSPLISVRTFVTRWLAPSGPPRLIRRTVVHCPGDHAPACVDLLLAESGMPTAVLRCSKHAERPPECAHACLAMAEAVCGPARAVILCPPGEGVPDEPEVD